jgi:hypothetical protein
MIGKQAGLQTMLQRDAKKRPFSAPSVLNAAKAASVPAGSTVFHRKVADP